jgi:hypothetical protein
MLRDSYGKFGDSGNQVAVCFSFNFGLVSIIYTKFNDMYFVVLLTFVPLQCAPAESKLGDFNKPNVRFRVRSNCCLCER